MCHAQIQLDPASPPQAVRQVQGGVYSSRITRARLQKLYTVSLLGNTTEEVALFLFFFFFSWHSVYMMRVKTSAGAPRLLHSPDSTILGRCVNWK